MDKIKGNAYDLLDFDDDRNTDIIHAIQELCDVSSFLRHCKELANKKHSIN